MAFSVGATTTGGTNTGGQTSTTVTGLSTTPGDKNVVEIVGTTATTTAPAAPTVAGWTLVGQHSQSASATPFVWIYESDPVPSSGAITQQTFSWTTPAATIEWYLTPVTGAKASGAVPSSSLTWTNRSTTTTQDTAAGTTADGGFLWFGFCNKNGTTAYSALSDTARNAVTYASSITSATRRETTFHASGYTYSKTATAASSSIGFGWAFVVVPAVAHGSAAGTVSWAGAATGHSVRHGSATGTVRWAGASSGHTTRRGTTTGIVAWSAAAAGHTTRHGAGTGGFSWAGLATGHVDRRGTVPGGVGWAGTAAGHAPTIASRHGAAAGTVSWSGASAGSTLRSGSAVGALEWSGQAAGHVPGQPFDLTISVSLPTPGPTYRASAAQAASANYHAASSPRPTYDATVEDPT